MTPKQASKDYDSRRTGGQYSILRAALGLVLFVKLATVWLATWDAVDPFSSSVFAISIATLLSLCVLIGWRDSLTAAGLLFVWAYMLIFEDWHAFGWDWALVFLLANHWFVSSTRTAPYGSWSARGRVDPGDGWKMPEHLVTQAWVLLMLLCSFALMMNVTGMFHRSPSIEAWLQVEHLLYLIPGLVFLVGAIWKRSLRPLSWLLFLALLVILFLKVHSVEAIGLSAYLSALLSLLFLFEPRWVRPSLAPKREHLYYDGECGLCHRAARFLLAEDIDGRAFSMAPLQGPTFEANVSAEKRATLPDSIIVQTHAGRLLTNSSAIVHMLLAVGGLWRIAGHLLALIPRPLRDGGYRFVASIRKRIFAQPKSLCPMLPPHLAERFQP